MSLQETADSIDRQENKFAESQLLSTKNILVGIALILSIIGLYFLSRYNYLFFHSTIEVFTIVVAIAIFTIAWNSRKTMDNNYLAFIGIAFLFIAVLDLLHTLSYKGMGVFPGVSANVATQLWIAMRYLFAFSLLIPLLFIRRRIKSVTVLASYFAVTTFLILSIFYWNIFPTAYVDGVGLTTFKIGSEFAISVILAVGISLLFWNRKQFSEYVFRLLFFGMVIAIATELAFTLYTDVYGVANMVGHLLDFFSFFLIYKALVETGFSKPYDLLFRNLKQSENALRESNARFQIMADGTPSLIWVTDKVGKHLFVNKYYLDYFGVSEAQVSGHNWQPLIHPDDRNEYVQKVMDAVKTQQTFTAQTRVQRNNGEWRWMETSASPRFTSSNEFLGHVGISIDITERKKTEQALNESEQRYHQLFSSMTEQFQLSELVYDEKGLVVDYRLLDVNPAFERLVGKTREQLVGKQVIKELWPVEQYWLDMFDQVLKTGEPAHCDNYGSAFDKFYELYVYRVNGNQLATIGTDISERKKTEMALRESDERFRIALKNAPVSVAAQDLSLRYIWAYNQRTSRQDQIIGKLDSDIFTVQEAAYIEKIKRRVLSEEVELREQLWFERPSGKIYLDVTWSPLRDHNGNVIGVTSATVDLTAMKLAQVELEENREQLEKTQKKLEENACLLEEYSNQMEELAKQRLERLRDSERLAAVGATAGMVGHDIRNPLQSITGDLYLAKIEADGLPDCEAKKIILESLAESEKNIDYINKIVQDLQDYARPLNPKREESDLANIFEKLIVNNRVPNNVKVNIEVADDSRMIKADSYYLNRILHNLVTNAVQAMPKGGELTISAHKETNETIISVKDTGVGIPANIQSKMFTVMFTTKSKGQGFGLPVVKRMTESLGGTVSFESQEGQGTNFTIRLPVRR